MTAIDKPTMLALLLALISACLIAVFISNVHRGQVKIESLRSQYYQSRDEAFDRIEDQSYMAENSADYQRIMKSVGTGSAQRRSWVEALSDAKDNLNLSELQFDVYPLTPINLSRSGYPINVGYEVIELALGLVHEGQLLKLFEYLATSISTPFEITSLVMHRVDNKKNSELTTAEEINLQVVCTIRWYSIGMIGDGHAIAQG